MDKALHFAVTQLLEVTAGLEEDNVGRDWPALMSAVRALRAAVEPQHVDYMRDSGEMYRVLEMFVTRDLLLYGDPMAVAALILKRLDQHGAVLIRYVRPVVAPGAPN